MSNSIIKLSAKGQWLEIDASLDHWWRLYVVTKSERLLLGAHTPKEIIDTLWNSLFVPWAKIKRDSSVMNGYEIKPSLHLYEGHTTMYVAEEGTGRGLFWFEGMGKYRIEMHVSGKELRTWQKQLLDLVLKGLSLSSS